MTENISAGCTLVQGPLQLAGINMVIIQTAATADDGDTIELDTIIGGKEGSGTYTKKILYVTATQDPTGTPVAEPMKWSDTTDTITIGGSIDDKRRTIVVFYE